MARIAVCAKRGYRGRFGLRALPFATLHLGAVDLQEHVPWPWLLDVCDRKPEIRRLRRINLEPTGALIDPRYMPEVDTIVAEYGHALRDHISTWHRGTTSTL
jgi:hypothetical protein